MGANVCPGGSGVGSVVGVGVLGAGVGDAGVVDGGVVDGGDVAGAPPATPQCTPPFVLHSSGAQLNSVRGKSQ